MLLGFIFFDLYIRRPFLRLQGYEVMLGSGTFGQVHKVHRRTNTHRKLAVTVLDFGRSRSNLSRRAAAKELAIVKRLANHGHPNIVRLYDVYPDNDQAQMYSAY